MTRPRIALVVDHPDRDLPGLTLVAHHLAEAGADVFLVPLNLLTAEVFSLVPDFVLLNYLRRNIESVMRGCRGASIAYGLLDTEGGLYGDLSGYGATFTRDPDLRSGVSVACAWGRKTMDFLVDEKLVPASSLVLTGVPRFDFYAPQWRAFFDARSLQVPDGDLLLVTTKIAVANPQRHSVEKEVELYVSKLGLPLDEVLRHRDIGWASIEATVELCNRLALDEPDLHIVLRPHPHERLATYANRINPQAENLRVIREGTVDGWIVRSMAVVHRQCTTAVEAGLAGVPAIAPQWVPTSAHAPDTEAVSIGCASYTDLVDLLGAIRKGEQVIPDSIERELARIIDDWFYAIDGRSSQRVAAAVLDRLPESRGVHSREAKRVFFRLPERLASTRGVAGRIAVTGHATRLAQDRWAALAHPASRRWWDSPKAFTAGQVAAFVDAIERADGAGRRGCTVLAASAAGAYHWGYRGVGVLVTAKAS